MTRATGETPSSDSHDVIVEVSTENSAGWPLVVYLHVEEYQQNHVTVNMCQDVSPYHQVPPDCLCTVDNDGQLDHH